MRGICVSFLLNEFLPILGLKSVDNGMGLIVFGAEEKVVDYAVLAQDQVAALPRQVDRFFIHHKDIIAYQEVCQSVCLPMLCKFVVFQRNSPPVEA